MSTELNGKTYNLPTVYDGQIVPPEEAIARAQQQGLDKFPSYGSSEEAELRYELMHQFMERDTADYSRSRSAGHARGGAADDDTFTDEDRTAVGRAWREPIEDRAHGGKLHYSQPLIRGQPPRGSYGLGRKTVDKLGNGDPKAGGFIVHQMFGIRGRSQGPDDCPWPRCTSSWRGRPSERSQNTPAVRAICSAPAIPRWCHPPARRSPAR